jgi:hypothetical protein
MGTVYSPKWINRLKRCYFDISLFQASLSPLESITNFSLYPIYYIRFFLWLDKSLFFPRSVRSPSYNGATVSARWIVHAVIRLYSLLSMCGFLLRPYISKQNFYLISAVNQHFPHLFSGSQDLAQCKPKLCGGRIKLWLLENFSSRATAGQLTHWLEFSAS